MVPRRVYGSVAGIGASWGDWSTREECTGGGAKLAERVIKAGAHTVRRSEGTMCGDRGANLDRLEESEADHFQTALCKFGNLCVCARVQDGRWHYGMYV